MPARRVLCSILVKFSEEVGDGFFGNEDGGGLDECLFILCG